MREPLVRGFESRFVDWGILDDPMDRSVDRLRCKRELEVDFRLADVELMEADKQTGEPKIINLLVKFREKTRMSVVWMSPDGNESVVYSSNCLCSAGREIYGAEFRPPRYSRESGRITQVRLDSPGDSDVILKDELVRPRVNGPDDMRYVVTTLGE